MASSGSVRFRAPGELRAIVFDLDDTLAPSKSAMDPAMCDALARLLERIDVGIISGGRFDQFEAQVLRGLVATDEVMARLHLMPTCGTRYYRWLGGSWLLQYAEDLTTDERHRAMLALEEGARALGLWSTGEWGDLIEDRGSQVTFSALGQRAPLQAKAAWDQDGSKKRALRAYVASRLLDLEVRGGGSTSIDITRRGIDKAYGIGRLLERLGAGEKDLLYVGDRLDETGNDYPVYAMGVACFAVEDWRETLVAIEAIIDWLARGIGQFPLGTMPNERNNQLTGGSQ